jgi:hypothetical protein
MAFLFALGIIALMVFHPGFRKSAFWLVGLGAAALLIILVASSIRGSQI